MTVSLQCMDRLLGLDTCQKTVTVEPGMLLSTLSSLLATVHLCLEISGPVSLPCTGGSTVVTLFTVY